MPATTTITYTSNSASSALYFSSQHLRKSKSPRTSASPAPQQDATGVNIERCKSIIHFVLEGTKSSSLQGEFKYTQGQLELNDISPQDQAYIMGELVKSDHLAIRFTCFPDLNKILLPMPSSVHETPINTISYDLNHAIHTIGHNPSVVQVQVGANTEFEGKTIRSIPDLHISIHTPDLDRVPETLWIAECGFTQPRQQIMKKFERYITDCPTLRVLTIVNIVELSSFANPSMKSTTTQALLRVPATLSVKEWSPGNRRKLPFGPIVTLGHTWMSISSVALEVWIAPPNGRIDLSDHGSMVYASGSLHPVIETGAIDGMLTKALELVRDRIIVAMDDVITDEDQLGIIDEDDDHLQRLAAIRDWSPPPHPIQWSVLTKAIVSGVWCTAFERYRSFHADILERHPGNDANAAAASSKKPKRS